MKLVSLILLSIALFFAALVVALAQPLPPALPAAAVGRTNAVKRASVARPVLPAVTNIVLTWDAYTNAYIEVVASTNLAQTNWVVVTNVPIWATNVALPITQPQQFFKTRAVFNGVLTNY